MLGLQGDAPIAKARILLSHTRTAANGNNKRAPTNGTASGAKDWKGVALMCTEKELIEAIEGHPSKLSSLKEFLRHENVASAVACAL